MTNFDKIRERARDIAENPDQKTATSELGELVAELADILELAMKTAQAAVEYNRDHDQP